MSDQSVIYVNETEAKENGDNDEPFFKPNYAIVQPEDNSSDNVTIKIWCSDLKENFTKVSLQKNIGI